MVFGGGTGIEVVGPKIWIWPMLCCFLTMAFVYFYCPEVSRLVNVYFYVQKLTMIRLLAKPWKRLIISLLGQKSAKGLNKRARLLIWFKVSYKTRKRLALAITRERKGWPEKL